MNYIKKNLGTFNFGVIIICVFLLLINIASIVSAIVLKQSIDFNDVMSVVVTIILGISTIVQAAQEEKIGKISIDLDIKNNTPYFAIAPIVEDVTQIHDYEYCENDMEKSTTIVDMGEGKQCQLIINDPLFERKNETILCSFLSKGKDKNEWVCRMSIRVKNISNTLISKIELCTDTDPVLRTNEYKAPMISFMELWDESKEASYAAANIDSMKKIYNNKYTNFKSDESIVCHLELPIDKFENAEEIEQKLKLDPKDAAGIINYIFFTFWIYIETIYGEKYIQKVEAGGRLLGNLFYCGNAVYVEPEFKRRDVYLLEKIEMDVSPFEKV